MSKYCSIALLLIFLASFGCQKKTANSPPNVIVIFIDDMGYGDIGPFGSTANDTPHLDRLAEEGLKLTSFYATASVCSPSRAALMTGSYQTRVGLGRGSAERVVLFGGGKKGLHNEELTIAEVLQKAGYTTGIFGKWHLGDQPQFLPTEYGFDEYFGIPYSNDMWPPNENQPHPLLPVLHNKQIVDTVKTMKDQAQLAHWFTDRAVNFIEQNKDQPFFVYLPHAFVHYPRAARQQFMAEAKTVTEAQVEEVDWSVGQIMQTLRKQGVSDNTLVLFTSDNGGTRSNNNGPLRGGKASIWEGGFRVPAVAWWPDTIPSGTVSDELATTMDLLPTVAHLAGVQLPEDRKIDGKNIAELLKNPSEATSPYERFFYFMGDSVRAVRAGSWKLIDRDTPLLFNLEQDIGESNNLADNYPEIVGRMKESIEAFEQQLRQQVRPAGIAKDPQTLLPRPKVEGPEAYRPTLSIETEK